MNVHRYKFRSKTDFTSVEGTLLLALWATESIFGESAVRLDAAHVIDEEGRTIEIDGSTRIGRTLNKLLVGFHVREYGPGAFDVERRGEPVPA
jgi:membrane-bound lytic murein transglycosylase B